MSKKSDQPIRLGVCGAGMIVHNHLDAVALTDGIEATAISSRTLKSAKRQARRYKIRSAYADHAKVYASPDVDLVLVATPNYQHFPVAMAAIENGKHVMVEKPLAMTVGEGRKMVAAAKKAGVHLLYAEQLPLAPKFARLAELARAGAFGTIYMVRQIERHSGPYSPWFFKKKTAGGGALVDLGCHSISTVLDILPGQRVEKVSAVLRTFHHTKGEVDDFAILQMHFDSGAIGVVEANWCHQGGMDSITEIYGDNGQGYADLMKGGGLETFTKKVGKKLFGELPGWNKPMVEPLRDSGYLVQTEGIVATIRDGAPPLQSGADGVEVLRIMAAAVKSSAAGGKAMALPR